LADKAGYITAVHAEYLPETRSGAPGQDSVKTKTAIHCCRCTRP